MAEAKTKPTRQSVREFLNGIADEKKRRDAFTVLALMRDVMNVEPKMWGPSIVGFGTWHYTYASGRQGDWPILAFSPRKQNLTVYMMPGFDRRNQDLLAKLGKHSTGKSCLYIRSLDDVHVPTLKTLMRQSVKDMAKLQKVDAEVIRGQ